MIHERQILLPVKATAAHFLVTGFKFNILYLSEEVDGRKIHFVDYRHDNLQTLS